MSEKCSQARKAYWQSLTQEEKQKVLENSILSKKSRENMAKAKVGFYGRMSAESRKARDKAISVGNKVKWDKLSSAGKKQRLNNGLHCNLSRKNRDIAFRKFIASLSPEEKRMWVERTIQSDKVLSGKGAIMKEIWDNYTDEERSNRVRNIASANGHKPSNPELIIQDYLSKHFPNEWIYNGDCSNGVVLGGKVPDFVNVNGEKIVLECFGRYWHQEDEIPILKAIYATYGFSCIIIWEDECNEKDLARILASRGLVNSVEEAPAKNRLGLPSDVDSKVEV